MPFRYYDYLPILLIFIVAAGFAVGNIFISQFIGQRKRTRQGTVAQFGRRAAAQPIRDGKFAAGPPCTSTPPGPAPLEKSASGAPSEQGLARP